MNAYFTVFYTLAVLAVVSFSVLALCYLADRKGYKQRQERRHAIAQRAKFAAYIKALVAEKKVGGKRFINNPGEVALKGPKAYTSVNPPNE